MKEIKSQSMRLNKKTKKGQAAVEFYVFLGAFLLFLGVIGFTFLNYASAESTRREAELAHEIGGEYADMINFALVAGDGFNGKFYPTRMIKGCLLYTSPSPRDLSTSRMPSSA